jgi:hypothetical protein
VTKVRCEYEDGPFDASEFAANGEHLHRRPRHYITGDLVLDTDSQAAPSVHTPPEAPPPDH